MDSFIVWRSPAQCRLLLWSLEKWEDSIKFQAAVKSWLLCLTSTQGRYSAPEQGSALEFQVYRTRRRKQVTCDASPLCSSYCMQTQHFNEHIRSGRQQWCLFQMNRLIKCHIYESTLMAFSLIFLDVLLSLLCLLTSLRISRTTSSSLSSSPKQFEDEESREPFWVCCREDGGLHVRTFV